MLSLKNLAKLQQKKYRQEYGLFLVEGKKTIQEAIASGAKPEQLVMTREFAQSSSELFPQERVNIVNIAEFRQLTETVNPEGIMAVLPLPQTTLITLINAAHARQIAILEDIRDPGNLGTMIRTADWFGLSGLVLLGGADPYQPKVVRASMGSLFHLPIAYLQASPDHLQALHQLKAAGFQLLVTRPELASPASAANTPTSNITTSQPQTNLALIFGNEAHGTSNAVDQLADRSISIPRYGQAESLNVAVSFGILLSQLKDYNKTHATTPS